MTATNQNFTMHAGDSKNLIITVEGGLLTGVTVKWALKETVTSTENIIYKTTTDGISINQETKEITISLSNIDTEDLSGFYYHEAELTDAQGYVSTITVGEVQIKSSGI